MNSRSKGKRGELEVARILREYGYNARRGQQYCGANGDADVVGLPGVHIEVKRTERLKLDAALEQSTADARPDEVATVWSRKNGSTWIVSMPMEDFLRLYDRSKVQEVIDAMTAEPVEVR